MAWQITMAASSGGVDWTTVLKPFLSKNYESSNPAEVIELCSAIVKRYELCYLIFSGNSFALSWSKNTDRFFTSHFVYPIFCFLFSESEILRHKESNKNFFNSFAVLAADYISSSTSGCKYFLE